MATKSTEPGTPTEGGPKSGKSSRKVREFQSDFPEGAIPKLHDNDEYTSTDQTAIIAPEGVRSKQYPAVMIITGAAAGRVCRIGGEHMSLGRDREADIVISDAGISRYHCHIVRVGELGYALEDNGSTNGTIVNGERVTRAILRAGDRIQLGPEVVLQFNLFDEAEEDLASRLYEAATRDGLTKALNRRAFDERFAAELAFARRYKDKLCIVSLDLDHFKKINDTHGHATGDIVLREVAALLMKMLRGEDILGRIGGEEFAIVARRISLANALAFAERLRKSVQALAFDGSRRTLEVTVSIGVAELSEVAVTPDSGAKLLELADKRLYDAKSLGRNRVVFEDA